MLPRPSTSTLFPYTTLFRSQRARAELLADGSGGVEDVRRRRTGEVRVPARGVQSVQPHELPRAQDRKSTRLNSSHLGISYAVFCLKKKKKLTKQTNTRNNTK